MWGREVCGSTLTGFPDVEVGVRSRLQKEVKELSFDHIVFEMSQRLPH